MGDTINLNGWQLGNFFKTGGPVLFGHDAQSPPIGRAIHIWSTGTRLKAVMQFASTPEAMKIRDLVETNFMRSTSVGMRPIKLEFSRDPQRKFGIDFIEQELIEFSIVSTPANRSAR
jgi:Escherichia/Staphylococcus phage prohead protease